MFERDIQNDIRLELSKAGSTLFRNNCARGWVGELLTRIPNGDIILRNARPLHAGLIQGSSDLIGWTPFTLSGYDGFPVTIAAFTAIEVKSKSGRLSAEQKNFLEQVNKSGGIGICARSPDEARGEIERWITSRQ